MAFGQKCPTLEIEWEMANKIENTENVCVYNLQISHDAEKNTPQWRVETLKHLEFKIPPPPHTHTLVHTHPYELVCLKHSNYVK